MAIQTLNTIKNWFKTGSKPSQDQFWDTWDSFQHKYEKVPIKDIEELETTLDTKAEKSQLDDHKNDQIAHAGLFSGKEDKYQKGVAGGYVPLDEFSKIAHQYLNLINNLTAGGENSILSAEQGVVLQNQIDNINRLLKCDNVDLDTVQKIVDNVTQIQTSIATILVNDLTSGGITKALTAEMGKVLDLNKEDKSQKGIPNGYVPLDEFSKIAHQYLSIVNNLTAGGATASLSAEQGVVLQSQIDGILTVLSSDNINLDTIQEIVDAIETVQVSLSTILVNDLVTGGVAKALTAEMGKQLNLIKLSATIATDAENQITASVPEDNKVVSRSKLFNWWNWIKTQTQTIGGVWNFSKGLKVTDSMSYTTEMKQDKFVSKLNLSPGVIFSTEYGFQGVKWISPDGGYVHLIADSTPAERYNYIYVPSKSGLLALAGDFITTPAGTKTEAPLIIPKGTLLTDPVNGAIETDANGIYYTIGGIRKNLTTDYVLNIPSMSAQIVLSGNRMIEVREDIVSLVTNKTLFNDFTTNQYAKYTIDVSGMVGRLWNSISNLKFELQMLVSNSGTPTTWYTISSFEDSYSNILTNSTVPFQISLNSELLLEDIGNKYVYITGKSSNTISESFFKTTTKNLRTAVSIPNRAEMLVSLRIKATTDWQVSTADQALHSSFGMLKMIQK